MTRPSIIDKKNKTALLFSWIPKNGADIMLKELKDQCKKSKTVSIGNRDRPKILEELLNDEKIVQGTKIINGRALVCYRRKIFSDIFKIEAATMAIPDDSVQEREISNQRYSWLMWLVNKHAQQIIETNPANI